MSCAAGEKFLSPAQMSLRHRPNQIKIILIQQMYNFLAVSHLNCTYMKLFSLVLLNYIRVKIRDGRDYKAEINLQRLSFSLSYYLQVVQRSLTPGHYHKEE